MYFLLDEHYWENTTLEFYMTDFGFDVGWILEDLNKMSTKSDIWLACVAKSIEVSNSFNS